MSWLLGKKKSSKNKIIKDYIDKGSDYHSNESFFKRMSYKQN